MPVKDVQDFRETLSTVDKRGRRRFVYPSQVKGRFFLRRSFVIYLLMAFYLAMPWVEIAGQQAIYLDIPGRKFIFFGTVLWATDMIFLFLLLAGLSLSLFFFTAVFGRVWCGWACPETVFLEFLFRPVERLIEGDSAKRKRLDEAPWNLEKLVKKGTKLFVFSVLAWILSSTFLAYFLGRETLLGMMQGSPLNNFGPFIATAVMMGIILFQFGWFREQFCTVVCPYARFQSVLMDSKSITVGYDVKRGEPRGKSRQKNDSSGDCIDCGLCVRVCPTGIDIRNGLQLECISCAACIDACDSVMKKIEKPLGLIRYDSEDRLNGKPHQILRPRVIFYSLLTILFVAATVLVVANRKLADVQLLRGSQDLPFSQIATDRVVNHWTLKISNKSSQDKTFRVTSDSSDIQIVMPIIPFRVAAESIAESPVFFNFSQNILVAGKKKILVIIESGAGESFNQEITLLGPGL